MQLTHYRLFRAAHTVGLQRIKKPFSLSAVEFGFSCSTNTCTRAHACTRTHATVRLCTHEAEYRHRIRCSHALSTDPPVSAPSYATSRDRISICCAHMYITVRKSARIVPLDQQSVFDGSYSSFPPQRPEAPRLERSSFFFFLYTYHRRTAALCFVSLRTGSKFINHR